MQTEGKGINMRKGRLNLLVWCGVWTLTCLLLAAPSVRAAGFALYEYSARGNAMAGALVAAQNPDASAVAYNPATMTELTNPEAMAGMTAISPAAQVVRNGVKNDTKAQTFIDPYAYYVHPISDSVVFGVGEFSRFGLGTKYDSNWAGKASLYDVFFGTYSLNPSLAFKVTDSLSMAIGLEVMRAEVTIKNFMTGSDTKMQTEGTSIGGNLGIFYKFNEQWAAGFTARTPMKLEGRGSIKSAAGLNTGMDMTTHLPDSYTLGLSYRPTEQLRFEADAVYTRWEQYDKFEYNFDTNFGAGTHVDSIKNWKNVWRFQLGGEYQALDWLAVRAGYVYDQSPIRKGFEDYMLPANDRQLVNFGLGFNWKDLTLDLSYSYLWSKDRDGFTITEPGPVTVPVEFQNNHAHLIGATVGYTF